MKKVAVGAWEKGVSHYYLSTTEKDLSVKLSAAKECVKQLTCSMDMANKHPQTHMYLAMAYKQLYVAQQELIKKKTEVCQFFNQSSVTIIIIDKSRI